MLRIVLINLFFLVLPTLIYLTYIYFAGKPNQEDTPSPVPVFWLFASGLLLMLGAIAYFIELEGGKPGEQYYPPVIKDGNIVPGRTERP